MAVVFGVIVAIIIDRFRNPLPRKDRIMVDEKLGSFRGKKIVFHINPDDKKARKFAGMYGKFYKMLSKPGQKLPDTEVVEQPFVLEMDTSKRPISYLQEPPLTSTDKS